MGIILTQATDTGEPLTVGVITSESMEKDSEENVQWDLFMDCISELSLDICFLLDNVFFSGFVLLLIFQRVE